VFLQLFFPVGVGSGPGQASQLLAGLSQGQIPFEFADACFQQGDAIRLGIGNTLGPAARLRLQGGQGRLPGTLAQLLQSGGAQGQALTGIRNAAESGHDFQNGLEALACLWGAFQALNGFRSRRMTSTHGQPPLVPALPRWLLTCRQF
jgi:hypothetical protein